MAFRPILYVSEILEWADAYYALHGVWPSPHSGLIPGPYWDTWKAVEMALVKGLRGLRPGQSCYSCWLLSAASATTTTYHP